MRNCKYGNYDETSKESIYRYALLLLNKSLDNLYSEEIKEIPHEYFITRGKGKLGDLVEKLHFGLEQNSRSEPDFLDANLELKTTPLKVVRNKYVSKERLVLGMIDYFKIIDETFEQSAFIRKNASLLLLFYLYEKEGLTNQIFKKIKLWDLPEDDYAIIKQDWEKISMKVRLGKAEELSGGDTFYLEAFRKGSGGDRDLTNQPRSDIQANRRAFGFKSKYINIIINDKDERLVEIITDEFKEKNLTFEEYIINKFKPYFGKTLSQISTSFDYPKSKISKNFAAIVSKLILGIKPKQEIEEFEKADILVKTITLEKSGSLKESMSFKNIDYEAIASETWETSFFFNEIVSRKFFFVIFQKNSNEERILKNVMFWNMPVDMLLKAESYWEDIKDKVIKRDFSNFMKLIYHRDFHVRPKGTKQSREVILSDGFVAPKLAYWINAEAIKREIEKDKDF